MRYISFPFTLIFVPDYSGLWIKALMHSAEFSYLSSHDHGRSSSDAQYGDVCLCRDEVQDLSDGLLICVVTEHDALQWVPCHLSADPIDDTFGVGLVHGDHLDFGRIRDVEEVLLLKSSPQGYFTRVAHQDDSNAERVDQLGTDGGKCWRAGGVMRRDNYTPLVAASPLASLSPWGTSRPSSWTSAPAGLADGQEDNGEEEQREGQREERQSQPRARIRVIG